MGRIVACNAVAIVWMMIRVFIWTVVAKKGAPRDTEEPYVRKVGSLKAPFIIYKIL